MEQNKELEKVIEILKGISVDDKGGVRKNDAWYKEIPDDPGVYLYSSKQDGILYIGDSKNLKERIKQETSVSFKFESSRAIPENLASTNIRLRQLIEKNSTEVELHCIPTQGKAIPICDIVFDRECTDENNTDDCVLFELQGKVLNYKTSLSKLACIAPKNTLALTKVRKSPEENDPEVVKHLEMSLERVLLMIYWLEFKHLPHWNLTF